MHVEQKAPKNVIPSPDNRLLKHSVRMQMMHQESLPKLESDHRGHNKGAIRAGYRRSKVVSDKM